MIYSVFVEYIIFFTYHCGRTLAGEKPKRRYFRNSTISKYPSWITALVVALSIIVLLTAFLLSAMRLYHIGYATFYETLEHKMMSIIAGLAIVVLSEAAAVLFTIALSVIGQSQIQKRILLASIAGTAALALSGNYYVALYEHTLTVFNVLEAMLPPLLTLSTAYVLKELLLRVIEQRHADQITYKEALSDWLQSTSNPESHTKFTQAYANELRDMLIKINRRRKLSKTAIEQFDASHWRILVRRELQTEDCCQIQYELPYKQHHPKEHVRLIFRFSIQNPASLSYMWGNFSYTPGDAPQLFFVAV